MTTIAIITLFFIVVVAVTPSKPKRAAVEVKPKPAAVEQVVIVEVPTLTKEPSALEPEEIFDQAWLKGIRTYSGLIESVRLATGKGTSKTRVRNWKISKGLIND